MTTNLLYIGKSKSFLTQFGKLEDGVSGFSWLVIFLLSV